MPLFNPTSVLKICFTVLLPIAQVAQVFFFLYLIERLPLDFMLFKYCENRDERQREPQGSKATAQFYVICDICITVTWSTEGLDLYKYVMMPSGAWEQRNEMKEMIFSEKKYRNVYCGLVLRLICKDH